MRIYPIIVGGLSFFAAAAAAADNDDDGDVERRCAKLAEARAAEFLEDETYAMEQRSSGPLQNDDAQRQLLKLDARAYRAEVYRDCRRRAKPATKENKAD